MLEEKTPEITDSLYRGKVDARIYDLVYEETEREDIPFWIKLARELNPRNILEVGVGTGRVSIPLARAGFMVTGLDLEETMLDIAREKTAGLSAVSDGRLDLVQGDARFIDLGQTFDLITIPLNTFCHFTTQEDQIGLLRNLKRHLDPAEGVLAIDMFNDLVKLAQRWDSSKNGPIPLDRPPIKICQAIDLRRKLFIQRHVRDYIEYRKEIGQREDILVLDREATVVDGNTTPPTVLQNRVISSVGFPSIFSLWAEEIFQKGGFHTARFMGDYNGRRFLDAKINEDLQAIEIEDHHRPISEKVIIITGPGQARVKIKDCSPRKAKEVREPFLELVSGDTKLKIINPEEAFYHAYFLSRFSKLSREEQRKVLEEMDKALGVI